MAEEDDDQEEAAPESVAVPTRQPSLLRYLPIVLIILALQAVGVYILIDRYLVKTEEADGTSGAERPRVIPTSSVPEASVDLGQFVVNPRSDHLRLLLTTDVVLAVAPDDAQAEIENDAKTDQVKDAVIYELTHATPEELDDRDGREAVKGRMKMRINELLYEGQVVEVYFSRFILQALPGYKGP